MNLQDTPVLVTGGASGLGEATALKLAAQGARVAILDVQDEKAQAVAKQINGIAIHCDVTSEQSAAQAIAQAKEAQGVARVLVNCAGGGVGKRVVGKGGPMPLEEFIKVVNLNLFGAFNMTRLAAAEMIAAEPVGEERGVILFTTSVAAYEGQIGQAAYAASKGGLVSLTIQLAREFAQFGVRVMSVAPGIFLTPLLYTASQEVQESLAKSIPFPQRLGQPDEFADLVQHIIGNRYLNGEVIRLDGATRLAPR
ncbi:SDR family NAD(P)-dependent oxidoreductase [Marinobacter sp. UBA2498]|jgi:NAD(P)-dependent dehydrogenase (short-subunit alcohol dehydrogenase family)|uniref:SDR family NAD(P)-dependent oxidoreductase n=1 Tax=Marinobacter sp. UBA2498 TaxID=1946813 RepID=UPI0025811A18|nr:SDR family NAD(P)-dependent oxidoreductase [Marinobacter sp. UBA2498]|tara:strand:+ start:57710 stop:58468 length:759 start_codon:yes stop_codon:yes gene_type:complete